MAITQLGAESARNNPFSESGLVRDWATAFAAWQSAHAEVIRLTGPDSEAFDLAADALWNTENRLLTMPAPTMAELLWKVEHLMGADSDIGIMNDDEKAAIVADVRRFASADHGVEARNA